MKSVKVIIVVLILIILGFAFIFLNKNKKNEEETPSSLNDLSSLKWEKVTEKAEWSGRDAHSLIVLNDKMYLLGGIEGKKEPGESVQYETFQHKNDVWVSDNGIDWQLVIEHAPWSERRSLPIIVFKDKMCLFGGWEQLRYGQYKNDVWCSQDGKDWQELASNTEWSPREGHSVVFFKDKLWLLAGVDFFKKELFNDVWYSEDGIKWEQVTESAPWPKRYDQALAVFQGKLWLIGGIDEEKQPLKDVWSSEDGTNWQLVTDSPPWPARNGHVLLEYKNALWIISGWGENGLSDVWYTKDGLNWEKPKKKVPWSGREDHAAVVFKDSIWMMGGMADEKGNWLWKNDIWKSSF